MREVSATEQSIMLPNDALWKIKAKIHAFYIFGILLGIIVLLISFRLGDIPNLAERLSFALTLASLLLAVLAIGYNVVSNTSFYQTISSLNNSSDKIATTSERISDAAKELSDKIEIIPSRLEAIEGKFAETNVLLKQRTEASIVIDQPSEEQPGQAQVKAKESVIDNAGDKFAERFCDGASFTGLLTLYSCNFAYTKQFPFNYSEIFTTTNLVKPEYAHGFMVATIGAGLAKMTNAKGVWNVTFMNEVLLKQVRPELDKRIQRLTEKSNEDPVSASVKLRVESAIKVIEQYFGSLV